jgi:uncharacterized lipoprotein
MMLARLMLIVLIVGLAACGGSKELTCDTEASYLSAVRAPRVQAPEDLDDRDAAAAGFAAGAAADRLKVSRRATDHDFDRLVSHRQGASNTI